MDYEILPSDGPPLILIRGLSRSRRYWLGLETRLNRSFKVLVFDNRGIGRSSSPGGLWTITQMAHDTAAVIRHAGFDKLHVFGMSMGGMIAQELVLHYPEIVDRLVLGCTTPGGKEGIRPSAFAMASLATALALPDYLSNEIIANLTLSPKHRAAHPETAKAWLELVRTEGVARLTVVRQLLAIFRHNTGPRLGQLNVPTLILTGDSDRLVAPRNSEILAERIPGACLERIPGAGHDFPAEKQEETTQAIERFCLG